jgi:catechol 2,3-dioxygenase-like lactoylglutathione lyase family enzyme
MSDKSKAGHELNDLLERGEISPEAYAEYANSTPHTRVESAMFDHLTLRVGDLATVDAAFTAMLAELEFEQTASTPNLSVWGNFALTQTDDAHPVARRAHIAFVAPTRAHVERFWRAGIDAGFTDNGSAGPRPDYADDYYAAFLEDPTGNNFEAVYRDGARPRGSIDHVGLRVHDVEATAAFYLTIATTAGLVLRRQASDRASFAVGRSEDVLSVVAGEPTENVHIAFSGDDDDVRRFHADATAAGYRSNGEPGERARHHDGYYAAYVLDPERSGVLVIL